MGELRAEIGEAHGAGNAGLRSLATPFAFRETARMNTSTNFPSPTGADLAVRSSHVDDPLAVVCIQHGMAEHSGRYGRFMDALAERGYASVAHDHRGHGATTAPDAALGHFAREDGWAKVRADALAVAGCMEASHEGAPLVVFGHSMGGLVSFDLALNHPGRFAGAAVWNIGIPNATELAALRGMLKFERFRRGSDVPSPLATRLTFEAYNKRFAPNRTAFDWLSRDRAEVDAYVADPLCGFDVTIGTWIEIAEAMARARNDERLRALPKDMPFHLLGGDKDPVTKGGDGVRHIAERLRAAGLRDVTDVLLPNTRHEALNEVNRDTTTNAFIDWLDARFAH